MKMFDVPGLKLVEESRSRTPSTRAQETIRYRRHTAKHYLVLQEIGNTCPSTGARQEGFHEMSRILSPARARSRTSDWGVDELFAFVQSGRRRRYAPRWLTTFWSMAAVRHGDYIAKVRLAPVTEHHA